MSYKPPFARMRHIKAKAPAPLPKHPQNVQEAVAHAQALQDAGEFVPSELHVAHEDGGETVVSSGLDQRFGTADDVVTEVPAELVTEVPEDTAGEEADAPEDAHEDDDDSMTEYGMNDKKVELLAIAEAHAVDADDSMTKATIIALLDDHFK